MTECKCCIIWVAEWFLMDMNLEMSLCRKFIFDWLKYQRDLISLQTKDLRKQMGCTHGGILCGAQLCFGTGT